MAKIEKFEVKNIDTGDSALIFSKLNVIDESGKDISIPIGNVLADIDKPLSPGDILIMQTEDDVKYAVLATVYASEVIAKNKAYAKTAKASSMRGKNKGCLSNTGPTSSSF